MKKLTDIKLGKSLTITGISTNAPTKIKRRLLDLGFTKGQNIRVVHKSLLSKDYLVELRHFSLTLRREILNYILVEE